MGRICLDADRDAEKAEKSARDRSWATRYAVSRANLLNYVELVFLYQPSSDILLLKHARNICRKQRKSTILVQWMLMVYLVVLFLFQQTAPAVQRAGELPLHSCFFFLSWPTNLSPLLYQNDQNTERI